MEISPRILDTFASTNSEGIIALKLDVYLKGATGDISGDIRIQHMESVDDYNGGTPSTRTVAGDVCFFWIKPGHSWTTTGDVCLFKINTHDATKNFTHLFKFVTVEGCVNATNSLGAQIGQILIKVGGTTRAIGYYATS
jgi:hypothetical protein